MQNFGLSHNFIMWIDIIFYDNTNFQADVVERKEENNVLQKRLDVLATLDCEEEVRALKDELSSLREKVCSLLLINICWFRLTKFLGFLLESYISFQFLLI